VQEVLAAREAAWETIAVAKVRLQQHGLYGPRLVPFLPREVGVDCAGGRLHTLSRVPDMWGNSGKGNSAS
jgi:hypothetical protein